MLKHRYKLAYHLQKLLPPQNNCNYTTYQSENYYYKINDINDPRLFDFFSMLIRKKSKPIKQ